MLAVFLVLLSADLAIQNRAKKIDAFHDAFDRFSGGDRLLRIEKCSFPMLGPLRLSCFVTRLCASRFSFFREASCLLERRVEIISSSFP